MPSIFRTLGLAFLVLSAAVPSAAAGQFDPLKRLREQAEALQKKIDCAVGDKACADKAKQDTAKTSKDAAAPAATLDAQVTMTALAPMPPNNPLTATVVSDDRAHAAGVSMKGSRQIVIVDGQEGPLFDTIVSSGTGAAVFSSDGKRAAYIGKRAGQEIAVIDGKEGPPATSIGDPRMLAQPGLPRPKFLFSKDGSRVAYVAMMASAAPGLPKSHVVLDGVMGPEYDGISEMMFVGPRFVYIGRTKEQKSVVVVDGKVQGAPFDGINLLMGSDDGHYAFVATRGNSWMVVLDGVEGKVHQRPAEEFDGRTLVLSPTNGRVAYVAMGRDQKSAVQGANLYLNGKLLRSATAFDGLTFSPDGSRLGGSVLELNPDRTRRQYVFVDGWNSLDYAAIPAISSVPGQAAQGQYPRTLLFSPDSKRYVFIAQNDVSSFAVVDGQESAGYAQISNVQFTRDSRRHAFEARYLNTPGGGGSVVVVDGKEGPKLYGITANSLTFSADGSRIAYMGNTTVAEAVAVVDGAVQKAPAGAFQARLAKPGMTQSYFMFSPDGRRIARVEGLLDGTGRNVVVLDGTRQTPGHLFSMPVFSPDGRRFAYAAWFNQRWLLSVDGKSMPIDGDLYEAPGALAFQADGSLRLLTVKDNMLSRMVLTLK